MSISPRKSKRKGDLVSALALSKLLGRDRASLIKWADEGMPYQSRPDANNAGEWSFYTAEVVDWIEERAASLVRAQYVMLDEDDDDESVRNPKNENEAKRGQAISDARKAYWSAVRAADAAARERGDLVRRSVALAVFDAALVGLKGELYNLTPQVSRDFDDEDTKVKVVKSLDGRLKPLLESICIASKDIPNA